MKSCVKDLASVMEAPGMSRRGRAGGLFIVVMYPPLTRLASGLKHRSLLRARPVASFPSTTPSADASGLIGVVGRSGSTPASVALDICVPVER